MKKYNVIWFVIDGVRTYRSGIDDRDRLDIIDALAQEAVEFTNAFTSAPSSIMAASSMFTGIPASYISRHYNDFEFNESEIDSIVTILMKNGYKIYSIFDAKALRSGLHTMAHSIPRKYRPKTSDHDKWWHNAEITRNIEHLFNGNYVSTPSFFLMWYNCRLDPKTSYHVEKSIKIFKENKMWDDSIIIMNSDHGYPDPSTGLTVETMKKYSHDMIITDDNSRIPLIIKYPECPQGRKINTVIRTSDIFHTVVEILRIDNIDKTKMNYTNPDNGRSLIDLINGNDNQRRIARIDTRLTSATSRVTALRSDNYKYVYYVDEDREEFFDIVKDNYEINDISLSGDKIIKEQIDFFRYLYKRQENDIYNYHSEILKMNIQQEIEKHYPGGKKGFIKNILLTCSPTTPYIVLELLVKYLSMIFSYINIDLVIPKNIEKKYEGLDFRKIISVNRIQLKDIKHSLVIKNKYDFVIYLTENSKYRFIDPVIVKALKALNTKKYFMMDYNFLMYKNILSRWVYPFIKFIKLNWKSYKDESLGYIINDILRLVSYAIKFHIFKFREQKFDTHEIKAIRDGLVFSTSNNIVSAINKDRDGDKIKRDNLYPDDLN